MPDGVEAVAVALVAIVPGATYTWSFERQAGAFGLAAVDRVLRFLTASLAFHLLLGWLEYLAWRVVAADRFLAGQFAVVWAAAVVLVALPAMVGWALGALWASQGAPERHARLRRILRLADRPEREAVLLRVVLGRSPAPRAWDHVFGGHRRAVLRAQLKDTGVWVGGLYAEQSYASGYPDAPQDLYIERAYELDLDGSFARNESGFVEMGSGILLRWDDVGMIEIFPMEVER